MNGTPKFFEFVERLAASTSASLMKLGAGGAEMSAGERERATEADIFDPLSPLPYLESSSKDCGTVQGEEHYEVSCVGCRNWFCKYCCVGRGLKLRKRLISVLNTFTGLTMWTLTIDPTLFAGPEEAFKYIREHRCISELMRKLKQTKYLNSGRYFYFVEWQKNTEMVHYHLLVDSAFVPFDLVCDIWNSFRPVVAGPVQGDRPGFGSVRYSKKKLTDARLAANYACAYLIKSPEHGYPNWILDLLPRRGGKSEVHRYSTSRGFWGESKPCEKQDVPPAADEHPANGDDEADELEGPKPSTIRERLSRCGEKSLLVRVVDMIDTSTGEVTIKRIGVLLIDGALNQLAASLGRELGGLRRLPITPDDVPTIRRFFACKSIVHVEGRESAPGIVVKSPHHVPMPIDGGEICSDADAVESTSVWAMMAGR